MPFSPVETAPPASTYTLRASTGSVTGAASVSSGCGRSSWPVPASPPGAAPSPAALPVPLAPPEPTWTCTLTLDSPKDAVMTASPSAFTWSLPYWSTETTAGSLDVYCRCSCT